MGVYIWPIRGYDPRSTCRVRLIFNLTSKCMIRQNKNISKLVTDLILGGLGMNFPCTLPDRVCALSRTGCSSHHCSGVPSVHKIKSSASNRESLGRQRGKLQGRRNDFFLESEARTLEQEIQSEAEGDFNGRTRAANQHWFNIAVAAPTLLGTLIHAFEIMLMRGRLKWRKFLLCCN